jgi:hypothetical protein
MPSDLATFKIPTPFASCFRTFRSAALSIFGRASFTGQPHWGLTPRTIRLILNCSLMAAVQLQEPSGRSAMGSVARRCTPSRAAAADPSSVRVCA